MMQKGLLRSAVSHCCVILIFVMYILEGTWGVCPGNPDRSVPYVAVPPDNYDRTYSSITSEGKQPLGFNKSVWHFNLADTPCIKVSDAATRRLEIMSETIPPARLCVKAQDELLGCSDPGTGQLYLCWKTTTATTVYLEFTCDSQCAENDVQFWYRFVLGDTYEQDPEDHWCENRRNDEYPQSLLDMSPDLPVKEQTTPGNVAMRNSPRNYMFLIVMFYIAGRVV